MSCVGTFSPDALDVIISNDEMTHVLTGFVEGTFVSIEPFAERVTPSYGARGEAYRVMNPVSAFNMTVSLSQTSHSNDILHRLLQLDRQTFDGTFNILVKDSSGTTLLSERCAYIGTEPTVSFSGGGTLEGREWAIHLPKPQYVIGGNSRFTPDEASNYEALGGNIDAQWQPQ
ncbi:MAG: DUF3277 domain-containing protein [Idiomarinaceae bacterium]|nr:DUF3277 domain-containing protein [Idiomarinaceae bacterium]|tara:strand:+ start:59596 stop:60114 length:519 start_codon:yes stop_codon:yes gene_type:complete